jgi:hypothetical protein
VQVVSAAAQGNARPLLLALDAARRRVQAAPGALGG